MDLHPEITVAPHLLPAMDAVAHLLLMDETMTMDTADVNIRDRPIVAMEALVDTAVAPPPIPWVVAVATADAPLLRTIATVAVAVPQARTGKHRPSFCFFVCFCFQGLFETFCLARARMTIFL